MKRRLVLVLVLVPIAFAGMIFNKLFWDQLFASDPAPVPTAQPTLATPTPPPTEYGGNIQVALLLDVSGSMGGLINQAKGRLWDIVNELSSAQASDKPTQLEIALYAYGSPDFAPEQGYTKQLTPFTRDLDFISEQLFALGINGGDEYCGQVIHEALSHLNWTEADQDLRMMFIAGNEPFEQGPIDYQTTIQAAAKRGIVVNTILCGTRSGVEQKGWAHGARLGKGEFMSINHNEAVVHVATPYDQQINQLNHQLNNTYIPYGAQGESSKSRQLAQDQNAISMGEGYASTRAQTKASKKYDNTRWDLVDANKTGNLKLEKVDRSTLHDSIRHLSTDSLARLIQAKTQERDRIQAEMKALIKKKASYTREYRSEVSKEQLDQAMLKAIRKQGEQKGLEFNKEEEQPNN